MTSPGTSTPSEPPFRVGPYRAGSASFVVACSTATLASLVEQVLTDLSTADEARDIVSLVEADDGAVSVLVPGIDDSPAFPVDAALARLVSAITRLALDAGTGRLHVHGAVLASPEGAVLLSAPSGTGKTTLAAALAAAGWTYVSDESIELDVGGDTVTGFNKPMLIKPGGIEVLPQLDHAHVRTGTDDLWRLVPASRIPTTTSNVAELTTIVVLVRLVDADLDQPPTGARLHPADAVVALMQQTMDAERFGEDALLVLAETAARCTCHSMTVGDLSAAVDLVASMVHEQTSPVQVIPVQPPDVWPTAWRPAQDVRSVRLDDRVVVHHTAGGAIAALDEAGSAVWLAIHGTPPSWWSADVMTGSGTLEFMNQLVAHGLAVHHEDEVPT